MPREGGFLQILFASTGREKWARVLYSPEKKLSEDEGYYRTGSIRETRLLEELFNEKDEFANTTGF
ncbi:hypothetical protein [Butyrivibrio sp. WCE2006]|uniref:hypothetical protein n=1 Tax=Butyrivibrio sp. WCE2006 TaxID=1410611 RepID=UPI0012DF6499